MIGRGGRGGQGEGREWRRKRATASLAVPRKGQDWTGALSALVRLPHLKP